MPVKAIPTAATKIPVAQASAESGFEMEDYGHSRCATPLPASPSATTLMTPTSTKARAS